MTPVPDAPNPAVARKRRRKSKPTGWQAIPMAIKILGGVAVLVAIAVPFAIRNTRTESRPKQQTAPAAASAPELSTVPHSSTSDLVISEAHYDTSSRKVKGVIANQSAKAYGEVGIWFSIRGQQMASLGSVQAKVGRVGPSAKVPFETDPLPQGAWNFELNEISAIPQ
jgi:cytoskeletal protein RodZ